MPEELNEFIMSNETIEKLSKPFGTCIHYEHIFTPELEFHCEKGLLRGAGWHHDYMGKIAKSGQVAIKNVVKGKHGLYKGEWSYGGSKFKESTFFPTEWSKLKVLNKIQEAMKNLVTKEIKNNREVLIGKTSEGIQMMVVLEEIKENVKEMITAYPIL